MDLNCVTGSLLGDEFIVFVTFFVQKVSKLILSCRVSRQESINGFWKICRWLVQKSH